jgi:hypothetical protein
MELCFWCYFALCNYAFHMQQACCNYRCYVRDVLASAGLMIRQALLGLPHAEERRIKNKEPEQLVQQDAPNTQGRGKPHLRSLHCVAYSLQVTYANFDARGLI